MNKIIYKLSHFNNELKVFKADNKEIIYSSFWFMEFGKTCAEVQNSAEELIYFITKKFQFWKWRMVYLIKDNNEKDLILISQNKRNTIYKIEIDSTIYEIKIHYKKKKSVYKNNKKIAEFDESLSDEKFIQLLVSDEKDIKMVFLLYTSLLIGETDQKAKTVMISQKQLETIKEPWN